MHAKIKKPPSDPNMISSSELEKLISARREAVELGVRVKSQETLIATIENKISKKLVDGAVPPLGYFVGIEHVPVQSRPAWKEKALAFAIKLKMDVGAVEADAQSEARAKGATRPELIVRRTLKSVK